MECFPNSKFMQNLSCRFFTSRLQRCLQAASPFPSYQASSLFTQLQCTNFQFKSSPMNKGSLYPQVISFRTLGRFLSFSNMLMKWESFTIFRKEMVKYLFLIGLIQLYFICCSYSFWVRSTLFSKASSETDRHWGISWRRNGQKVMGAPPTSMIPEIRWSGYMSKQVPTANEPKEWQTTMIFLSFGESSTAFLRLLAYLSKHWPLNISTYSSSLYSFSNPLKTIVVLEPGSYNSPNSSSKGGNPAMQIK